jgi:hypothetical protein
MAGKMRMTETFNIHPPSLMLRRDKTPNIQGGRCRDTAGIGGNSGIKGGAGAVGSVECSRLDLYGDHWFRKREFIANFGLLKGFASIF